MRTCLCVVFFVFFFLFLLGHDRRGLRQREPGLEQAIEDQSCGRVHVVLAAGAERDAETRRAR